MSIKCDGVIFDVDGTLWDSTNVVKDAWNDAFVEAGYPFPNITADRLKGLFGLPMNEIIKDVAPNLSKEEAKALALITFDYEHRYLDKTPGDFYPNVLEVMRAISKVIPVYIISNCQGGYIEMFMKKGSVEDIVKDFTCPAYTGKLKGENIKLFIEKHNLKNPLYVGDTIMDERASKEAKCPFCYAEYGFGVKEAPDYIIKAPIELLDLLGIE